jgi:codanin-1
VRLAAHLTAPCQDGCDELAGQYQDLLLTLRVLAKFLGFLEALPYATEEPLSEELAEVTGHVSHPAPTPLQAALSVRAGPPVLDLGSHLAEATARGRLLLTLPWTVELLGQLDQVTLALPAYRALHLQLAVLYQTRLAPGSPALPPLAAALLSLQLGWLFEGRHFPRELLILARLEPEPTPAQEADTLDQAEVVSRELVGQCCPWLQELRGPLQRWEGGRRGSQLSLDRLDSPAVYKKIALRPAGIAPLAPRPVEDQQAVLQAALEKAFFHNQTGAIKRTVDFLAERLASNVIKKVRTELVSEERLAALAGLQALLGPEQPAPPGALAGLEAAVPGLAERSVARIRASSAPFLDLRVDSEAGLGLMLSSDTSPAAREACVAIVSKTVRDKVEQYVAQHVTVKYFTHEYRFEAEKLCRRAAREPAAPLPSAAHRPAAAPPSRCLGRMKQDLRELLVDGTAPDLSETRILAVLQEARTVLTARADLTPAATRGLETLSLDWILGLLAHRPELLTAPVLGSAVELWTALPPPHLASILCPRNLLLLRLAPSPRPALAALARLLAVLLAAGLLSAAALETSCRALVAAGEEPGALAAALGELGSRGDFAWVEGLFPSRLK